MHGGKCEEGRTGEKGGEKRLNGNRGESWRVKDAKDNQNRSRR